jgi:hypothetical protein
MGLGRLELPTSRLSGLGGRRSEVKNAKEHPLAAAMALGRFLSARNSILGTRFASEGRGR